MTDMIDEKTTALLHQLAPLTGELGIEVLVNSPSEVRTRLAWQERLCNSGGMLHGGTIMALGDTTGAACAVANLPEGSGGTVTIESKTNFLRPIRAGYAVAVARPLHAGRRLIVVEIDVLDDHGVLAARIIQTQAVL